MSAPPPSRPLDGVGSIELKIGLLVGLSVVTAALVSEVGSSAGAPVWLTLPVTLAVTQWLARGMTAPLREMTAAAARMATGDDAQHVTATSADEVGRLARAFNTMAVDLATADKQRRHLVATVSHELRTPLAAQRLLLENLVDGVVHPGDDALETPSPRPSGSATSSPTSSTSPASTAVPPRSTSRPSTSATSSNAPSPRPSSTPAR